MALSEGIRLDHVVLDDPTERIGVLTITTPRRIVVRAGASVPKNMIGTVDPDLEIHLPVAASERAVVLPARLTLAPDSSEAPSTQMWVTPDR